jgi:ATP-dependent 26S proteasome regulatory subunit
MSDVVLDRKNQSSQSITSSRDDAIGDALIAIASQNRRGPGEERKKDEDKLNLGHILERLEGMESMENAIYIATSNHPEKLDKALTRPGRFGFNLELSYCSDKMLVDIISMMYELNESEKLNLYKNLPSNAINIWTPAEIIEACQVQENFEKMVQYLSRTNPCRL